MASKKITPPTPKRLQLLKLKLQSLKAKIKLPKINIRNIFNALLLAGMMLYAGIKGPQLHASFLRSYVGSKVYQIRGSSTSGGGTGFSVKSPTGQTYILTNAHVCEGALEQSNFPGHVLVMYDGGMMPRRVIEISGKTDLCLIEGLPGVEGLSVGSAPEVGEVTAVIGHPLLRPLTISRGEVIGHDDVVLESHTMKTGDPEIDDMIGASDAKCDMPKNFILEQEIAIFSDAGVKVVNVKLCLIEIKNTQMLDVVIHPGNSGSPMVDFFGNVTGVMFAGDSIANYGYGVSYEDMIEFLSRY